MRTNHPFARWIPEFDNLNVIDGLGRPRCGQCGMPRAMHADDEPDQMLTAEDLRKPF